ncbi:cold-regulated 413 plasma membrane protein 4-like [Juglans microcarpa x Juglans regia]|uniref:cold-regulated 413 plasma membrane protein 4-like n=1 Tax=Juglans microcarpa x Juglans regia TaxID=2249226 RepID=UPI001B7F6E7C|nr:cold-regulated 413 plasma membrane protein 4-like [Juglans microcarpa x Juglans regia]
MGNLGNGVAEAFARIGHAAIGESSASPEKSSAARSSFQWGGTFFALFLLLLNRTGQRSSMKTTLLVLYLFTSFPTALFKIIRGQFGCWVAFLAVAANLFDPRTFPAARFLLFVITPDGLVDGLRDDLFSCIFCLIIGVSVVIIELRAVGGGNCQFSCHCFASYLGIVFLFYFTIQYLCWLTK